MGIIALALFVEIFLLKKLYLCSPVEDFFFIAISNIKSRKDMIFTIFFLNPINKEMVSKRQIRFIDL